MKYCTNYFIYTVLFVAELNIHQFAESGFIVHAIYLFNSFTICYLLLLSELF